MNTIVLLLGGNLGNKLENLSKARLMIENMLGRVIQKSSIYGSEPWGFISTEIFFNQVIVIESELNPFETINKLQNIEDILGRIRDSNKWISRTMDIDILFFNSEIINNDKLTIPHKLMQDRRFVLFPLHEIMKDFIHQVI